MILNGVVDNYDIVESVRSNDLRPTGMSTTEDASGVLDDLDCNVIIDNFDFDGLNFYFDPNTNTDCCPGDVRPTRIMAE